MNTHLPRQEPTSSRTAQEGGGKAVQKKKDPLRGAVRWLRRLRERWRPPRRLRVTFLGKIVMGVTIVLGVAAINTGNNLLYLVLGILFGIIAASGFLSEEVVRDLSLHLSAPQVFLARSPVRLHGWLESEKKVGTHLVEIALFGELPSPRPLPFYKRFLKGSAQSKEQELGSTLVRYLPPGGKCEVSIPLSPFPRRGVYRVHRAEIRTRFPFQFYEKIRDLPLALALEVAPAPRLTSLEPHPLRERLGEGERFEAWRGRGEEEFQGLHPYTLSDPLSRIHWRRAVPPFPLMVKEFQGIEGEPWVVVLGQGGSPEAFEEGLEEVAGIIVLAGRQGRRVILRCGPHPFSGGAGQREELLRVLARLRREELPPGPVWRWL